MTWIGRAGELLAFDTGPGNAMIDDWMQQRCGLPRDEDGALAAGGRVHDDYVTQYLRHSSFGEPPPKSLDRNAFPLELVDRLSPEDGGNAGSLHGGQHRGRARPFSRAAATVGDLRRRPAQQDANGHDRRPRRRRRGSSRSGAWMATVEAEAWAYLAVRSLEGLPITFPGTTGGAAATSGGVLAKA